MLMCKHRRKSQAMFKPFSDISFARHSDIFRERKKGLLSLKSPHRELTIKFVLYCIVINCIPFCF